MDKPRIVKITNDTNGTTDPVIFEKVPGGSPPTQKLKVLIKSDTAFHSPNYDLITKIPFNKSSLGFIISSDIMGDSHRWSPSIAIPVEIDFNPPPNSGSIVHDRFRTVYEENTTKAQLEIIINVVGNVETISPGDLEIFYINVNPHGPDVSEGEVIWITNTTTRYIDLFGCKITHRTFNRFGVDTGEATFFEFKNHSDNIDHLLLPPSTSHYHICMVFTKHGPPPPTPDNFVRYAGSANAVWNNTGDTATIKNIKGQIIHQVTYGKGEFIQKGKPEKIIIEPPTHFPPTAPPGVQIAFPSPMIIPITKNTWDGFGSMIQVMKRSAGKDIPISLKNGDILDFKTSGTIWPSWVPLPPTINANGFNDLFWPLRTTAMDDGLWPLKDSTDANAFCLYAMIAEDEMGTGLRERFAVMDGLSSHIVSATPTHGRPLFLFLGINDFRLFLPSKPWIIMDGTGGFDCSVTVTTP